MTEDAVATVSVEARASVAGMRRGERGTLRSSSMIDGLIRRGLLTKISEPAPDPATGEEPAAVGASGAADDAEASEEGEGSDDDPEPAQPAKKAPAKQASKRSS